MPWTKNPEVVGRVVARLIDSRDYVSDYTVRPCCYSCGLSREDVAVGAAHLGIAAGAICCEVHEA